jgi:hypothetical protein
VVRISKNQTQILVDFNIALSILEYILIDSTSDNRKLCDKVVGILVTVVPVTRRIKIAKLTCSLVRRPGMPWQRQILVAEQ